MRGEVMNNRVFITGGAKGIGRSMVRAFAQSGRTVAFTYNKSKTEALALVSELDGRAFALCADLSDPMQCRMAAQEAAAWLGGIDVLINNAGIAQQKLFTDISDKDWLDMLNVNLSSAFYITREALPYMIRQKSGRIINISSIWGICGASCEVHYSAAKAGLIGMTKALAAEIAPSGITVNCIAPGVIATDMSLSLGEETMRLVTEGIPAGRLGTPDEVAQTALFLASEGAQYITGQVISINGGMLM